MAFITVAASFHQLSLGVLGFGLGHFWVSGYGYGVSFSGGLYLSMVLIVLVIALVSLLVVLLRVMLLSEVAMPLVAVTLMFV